MNEVFKQGFKDASSVFFTASLAFGEGNDFRDNLQGLATELLDRSKLETLDLSANQVCMEFATLSFVVDRMRATPLAKLVNEDLYASQFNSAEEMFFNHETFRADCPIDLSSVAEGSLRAFDFYEELVGLIQDTK